MEKVDRAFELFDAFNKQDPEIIVWEGESYPAEYFYALKLHEWVRKLEPNPSTALSLASRCQHIGRWMVPRETYPTGKVGYYKWRTDLAKFHADKAAELMMQAGIDEETIQNTQQIIRKENLRSDGDVQTMESALCLVFLQFQYDDFIKEHDDEKVVRILKKTWGKMNEIGRQEALNLRPTGRAKELLEKALSA